MLPFGVSDIPNVIYKYLLINVIHGIFLIDPGYNFSDLSSWTPFSSDADIQRNKKLIKIP